MSINFNYKLQRISKFTNETKNQKKNSGIDYIRLFDNGEDCCGCSACYSICPVEAISMESDEEGFLYPTINTDICIHCKKCVSVCTFKSDQRRHELKMDPTWPKTYAVKHKDLAARMASRSGGVFTAVSDLVLQDKGVVYGCILNEEFDAVHARAQTKEQRNKMRGSKYVQSMIGNTFLSVKKDLDQGRQVLFSGTSCQIAGLRAFLNNENQNLFCVDIVCHGVPSPKVWKKYLKWQEQRNHAVCSNVDFRNKQDYGWKAHIETLFFTDESGNEKKISSEVFKKLFYGHNILRPCCYKCPYKSIIHPGDITIADYWGIDKAAPGFNDDKGVSLILINNKQGFEMFQRIKDSVIYKGTEIKDSLQQPLIKPYDCPKEREKFWSDFFNKPFSKIARKYGAFGFRSRIRKIIKNGKRKVKGFIK